MIKPAILNVLNACGGYALTRSLLKTEVQSQTGGIVGDTEFADALVFMQDKGLVASRVDPLSNDRRFFITSLGKTAVAQ